MFYHVYSAVMALFMCSFFFMVLCMWVSSSGVAFLFNVQIFKLSGLSVVFPILLDSMTLVFSSLVCFISANVVMYSVSYMDGEYFMKRFIYTVVLFVISMNFMIFIPSSLFLLIGWDGLGVVSFLLVIYFQNSKSLCGGMVTCLSNRIGDVFLIMSLVVGSSCGTWSFWSMNLSFQMQSVFLFLVCLGAFTKSAQFPFCSWLPMAMAAPTPVSALVHSSTLVTAGVYLLIRFSNVLVFSSFLLNFMMVTSCVTMVIASFSAIQHWDAKKIVALSTLSQLGFMVFCISVGMPELAFYHLCIHAIFKALIFMCVGVFIHCFETQDLRKMGGIVGCLPYVSFIFISAQMSLAGFPFLSGYFSKDLIVEGALDNSFNYVAYLLVIMSIFCTSWYSVRLTGMVLYNEHRNSHSLCNFNELSFWYIVPMFMLMVCSMTSARFLLSFVATQQFFVVPDVVKVVPLFCVYLGSFYSFKVLNLGLYMESFFKSLWFLDFLTTQQFVSPSLKFSYKSIEIDQGWFEASGGVSTLFMGLTKVLQVYQQGLKVPFIFVGVYVGVLTVVLIFFV